MGKFQDNLENGYYFNFGQYFERAWKIFVSNMSTYVGFTAVYIAFIGLNYFLSFRIPFGFQILNAVITPPLIAGFHIGFYYAKHGKLSFDKFFTGFNFFMPLFLFSIVSGIFVAIGFFAFIIPAIYLSVAYLFTTFFIVFHDKGFWEAMELSRKIITKNWFAFFGFGIIMGLIAFAGAMFMIVGALFTIPFSYALLYAAFEDIVGTDEEL